jgi:hypothetical protein
MTPNEEVRLAAEEAKKIKDAIKHGVTKEALKALKKRFAYHLPAFQYRTQGFMAADSSNVELIKLHAAVRDGQREVITYIEQILQLDYD